MALFDVSRMITVFQRLCHFAEEFTEEYRLPLVEALAQVFQVDLGEGEQPPDVGNLISSLVRRLRSTFEKLLESETELIVAIKDNTEFSNLRQKLTQNLRAAFERARSECRTHYGREAADRAGFPTRIAVNSSAVDRQTKVVSLKMRKPDFELGDPLVEGTSTTVESILAMYEPRVEELRDGLSESVRRRARIHGRQVAKNTQMSDFQTTYSLIISMVRSSFRLAGQKELAKRLTLSQPSRRTTTTVQGDTPDEDTPDEDTPDENPPADATSPQPSVSTHPGDPG